VPLAGQALAGYHSWGSVPVQLIPRRSSFQQQLWQAYGLPSAVQALLDLGKLAKGSLNKLAHNYALRMHTPRYNTITAAVCLALTDAHCCIRQRSQRALWWRASSGQTACRSGPLMRGKSPLELWS